MNDRVTKSNSTTDSFVVSSGSATTGHTIVSVGASYRPSGTVSVDAKKIEAAVYAHIRALRALGHTEVSTTEIARALQIPPSFVIAALQSLEKKGVKAAV